MKIRLLVLAGLIFVVSSVICAQNLYIVSSSPGAFRHILSYAWSQQPNPNPIADSFLADEVRNQINKQLQDYVGLVPDRETAGMIVVASEMASGQSRDAGVTGPESGSVRPEDTPGSLVVELYDSGTKELLWRGVAENVLHKGASEQNKQVVDRTIAQMFTNYFPYRIYEWVYPTP